MTGDHEDAPELVLGPDEIINYPLGKATRGYAVKDVDDLLDQLAVQTQDLLERLSAMEAERDRLRHELSEASEAESMLKRTLVTAQRAAEASVAEAREEAEELRQRARDRAEALLASAAEQAHELREAALRRARADEADIRRYRRDVEEHVESLRTFAADHRARLAHHLQLQQERLSEMEVPDPPPPPDLVEDDVLGTEVEDLDLAGIVDQLSTGRGPAEEQPDGGAVAGPEDAGDAPERGHGDVHDEDAGGHAASGETAERLFGA